MDTEESSLYLICPGFHDLALTDSFLTNFSHSSINRENLLIFPTDKYPPYSGFHLLHYLQKKCYEKSQKLTIIAFSAGVVAAITAAWQWQLQGNTIKGLIAFDGWGVPLFGPFPIYRVSHDQFTHDSSILLGTGSINFYADPAVEHLDLWRSPHLVQGWMTQTISSKQTMVSQMSLIDFLITIIPNI
ncbi:hypothetical protein [Crocosphaera chwakensis]|uniref:Uncharacterized protein n=1 Tax=Crocosphaera chwakensis CCY0110 TaxID=391612 RepID=A3ISZ9_9CHRO|nr:hypothetical protein [Crocosphaera chwakensis]EAZ90430.1 hypothetical protein CY0110_28894 [Crocosphaera chwakensis CCY0110]